QETAVLTVLLNGQAAQSEIDVLTKKADSLRDAITKAAKDGNTALAQSLRKELSENVKTTQALQRGVVDVGKVLNNLSTAKPKELRATLLQLNKQLQFSDLKRGSAEWNQLQANIQRVKLEMKTISAESQIAESRLTRLSNGFNKYFSMAATGVAAITGLSMTFRKLAGDGAKMDDTYADVMKTTGLTH
ncbi:hypothetical protein, partial [Candidatus Symbiothrix dinenymphae]|uniref:hypothetical protein n=1 Tax=Candidatus Symbiothrix dinenymphae TaxID=467085 RepID=UPI000AE0CF66